MESQLTLFDYSALDVETRIFVQERTREIKDMMKRTAQDIVEIGGMLTEVKDRLGHGNFGSWLSSEFDWTWNTAGNFMRVYDKFKFTKFVNMEIAPSALYLLAAPSTPEYIRQQVIERAEAGDTITHQFAKELIRAERREVDNFVVENRGVKTCGVCGNLWAADLPYCPYCNITPEARIAFVQSERQPHVANNSGENEWYTPSPIIEAARRVMGSIDTDPASSDLANETVRAGVYFTQDNDGLVQTWTGNVWMNPPYAQPLMSQFAAAVSDKFADREIEQACVLVNNATETVWFQQMLDECSAVCFLRGRVKFIDKAGNPSGAPLQGQAVLYFGNHAEKFTAEFYKLGKVLYV